VNYRLWHRQFKIDKQLEPFHYPRVENAKQLEPLHYPRVENAKQLKPFHYPVWKMLINWNHFTTHVWKLLQYIPPEYAWFSSAGSTKHIQCGIICIWWKSTPTILRWCEEATHEQNSAELIKSCQVLKLKSIVLPIACYWLEIQFCRVRHRWFP